jgi:type I restriction enzyme S subunit
MNRISKTTLGELVEFQRGYDLPKSQFIKGKIPVISSNGILGYHNQFKVKAPGITIGRSGTVGLPHYINEDFFPHNTALFIKDFKGNHEKYIFYLIKILKLNEYKSGSGVPTMNRNHLHPIEVNAFLDYKTQQKIAKVLSDLDAKIELNNKINLELEAMAKTLYDYWFVQFDFPDANGKPYKTSGGKMVWNEELKREIPEGWEVKTIAEYADFKNGKGIKKEDLTDNGQFAVYGSNGIVGRTNQVLFSEPVISIGRVGANYGEVYYSLDKVLDFR